VVPPQVAADRQPPVRRSDAARLAAQLTDRDRQIAEDCFEHRILTTEQLRRLHFASTRIATRRLGQLHALRVLDRFRPFWQRGEGSTPYHWTLDTVGAYVVAAGRGLERSQLGWSRQPAEAIASTAALHHRWQANEFATQLIAEVRAAGGDVPAWYGERGGRELLDDVVAPDSYLLLERRGAPPLHLLLEMDRGTEDRERLLAKAHRYAKGIPRGPFADAATLVLLTVPTDRRARTAAAALASGPWPVAVETWVAGSEHPLAVVERAERCSLSDLTTSERNSS
jgi:hypothetical protein